MFGAYLQYVRFNSLVLGNTRRSCLRAEMLVVSAAVDVKYLAKKIKPMLEAKDMNGG